MGFYFSLTSTTFIKCPKAHPLRWVGLPSNLLHFYFPLIDMGFVLRQSSCDGEAPLQLLHLNLLFNRTEGEPRSLSLSKGPSPPWSTSRMRSSILGSDHSFRVRPWLVFCFCLFFLPWLILLLLLPY